MKPRLLDLFSGAGGCAKGYMQAGFHVIGVDILPQPRYCGDAFIQADALVFAAMHGHEFDAIHASPPCQFGSVCTPMAYRSKHRNLIPQTRDVLSTTGRPFVIENVENVRRHLIQPIKLCGTQFGLNVWRHRYFELHPFLPELLLLPQCRHDRCRKPVLVSGTTRRKSVSGLLSRREYTAAQVREAMVISWMTRAELDQAIPPAYTEFIGSQLIRYC